MGGVCLVNWPFKVSFGSGPYVADKQGLTQKV